MPDEHANLAYTTIATAPSPAVSGTSLTVAAGTGTYFPTAPFNCTVWPVDEIPTRTNAEILRVTAVVGDVLTIDRAEEGTSARTIVVGDQIANTITKKTLTDIEAGVFASDVEVTDSAKGLILTSPDATRWRITIDNAGVFTATPL